jgi:hypothetical protein
VIFVLGVVGFLEQVLHGTSPYGFYGGDTGSSGVSDCCLEEKIGIAAVFSKRHLVTAPMKKSYSS